MNLIDWVTSILLIIMVITQIILLIILIYVNIKRHKKSMEFYDEMDDVILQLNAPKKEDATNEQITEIGDKK